MFVLVGATVCQSVTPDARRHFEITFISRIVVESEPILQYFYFVRTKNQDRLDIFTFNSEQTKMTKRSSVITMVQKKGLLTVLFIILSESIALTNAVQFYSTYKNWSNQYGRGRFANHNSNGNNDDTMSSGTTSNSNYNGRLCKETDSNSQCLAAASMSSTESTPVGTAKLHPRQNARAASRTCTTAMYNCCKESCPSCLLDIRGGNIESVAENVAAAAAATATTAASTSTSVPTPYNIPLNMWKVIFQIFLTALNVACWLIPLRAKKISENKFALGIANAFSGGVFLSLAFGHLIPECVSGFEGMNEALPYMIVLGGYLLIFFVEKVAFETDGLMQEAEEHTNQPQINDKQAVSNGEGTGGDDKKENNVGRSAVILLGALAVHSILEMTALGLARSFGDTALLTLSIALHQVRVFLFMCKTVDQSLQKLTHLFHLSCVI